MDLKAKAIFAYTNTGRTATMLAGFFPQCPIYIITDINWFGKIKLKFF